MANTRRDFLGKAVAGLPLVSGAEMVATVWRGQKVLQFGTQILVPVGLATHSAKVSAEPFTILALFLAGFVVLSVEKRNQLMAQNAWMKRPMSSSADFHESKAADKVVTPPYREIINAPNFGTIDTRQDGLLKIEGPVNPGHFRKDMSEDEFTALRERLAFFPKTERLPAPPAVVVEGDAAKHMKEAWKLMGSDVEKVSYLRSFSDVKGTPYMLAMEKGEQRNSHLFKLV